MASITQPRNSKSRVTPYSQRLLQYGLEDSRIYLSKATNSLLLPWTLGYNDDFFDSTSLPDNLEPRRYEQRLDCILDGLENTYILNENVLEVNVNCGSLIVDSTLLVFPEPTNLDLDLSPYGDIERHGQVVLSVQFQWIDNVNEVVPLMKLNYLDPDDNSVLEPNGWWVDRDRLIINVFDFYKLKNGLIQPGTIKSWIPAPTLNNRKRQIIIKNLLYEVAPLSKLLDHMLNLIRHLPIKTTTIIPGRINPRGLPESIVNVSVELENNVGSDLVSISTNIVWNPKILHSPIITEGSSTSNAFKDIQFIVDDEKGIALIQIESNLNNNIIMDGNLANITFQMRDDIPGQVETMIEFINSSGIDVLDQHLILENEEDPIIFTTNTLPIQIDRQNMPIPGEDYSKLWTYGQAPYYHTNREQFYAEIDISLHSSDDVVVQAYIDNLQISPSGIEHLERKIRIWMPDSFIRKDYIPDMKIIILG